MSEDVMPYDADLWRSLAYATDDGKLRAEYRVDGAEVVVRVHGQEHRAQINRGASAIQVAKRIMAELVL